MSGFNLNEYVDVAERIKEFKAAHKEGSLQSEIQFVNGGVLCVAHAYRTPEDTRPGVGHAFEPIPGKTPYTKDSEVMNAETSAWGRAIVALGFETKKIASRQEVEARKVSRNNADGDSVGGNGAGSSLSPGSPAPHTPGPEPVGVDSPGPGSPFTPPAGATNEPSGSEPPPDGGDPASVLVHFGKNAGKRLGDLSPRQREWYASTWEPNPQYANDVDRRLKMAARILCGTVPGPDDDLPF